MAPFDATDLIVGTGALGALVIALIVLYRQVIAPSTASTIEAHRLTAQVAEGLKTATTNASQAADNAKEAAQAAKAATEAAERCLSLCLPAAPPFRLQPPRAAVKE